MTGGLLPFAALRVIRELTSRCLMSCGPYFTFRRKRVTKRLLLFPTPFWKTTIAYPCRTTQVVVAEAHPVRPSAAAAGMTARASILVLIDLATSLIAPEDGASQRRSLAERSCSYPLPANSMRRRRTVLGRRVRAKGRVEPGRRPAGPGARTRSLHDRGLVAGPVRLTQHPLIQLAGGGPRHVGHEVDGPRALEVRDPGPAVLDQLAGQVGPGAGQVGGLPHGLHLLAQVLVRDADHGHVEHGGMSGEQVLGLLGVDVDAARDDHVALAVGEVQVSVGVDMADVPDGAGAVLDGAGGAAAGAALGGLDRIGEVRERGRAAEPDRAVGAGRALLPLVVEDEQLTEHGAADRAGMSHPLRGVAEREAVGLGGAVVLGDDRAQPVDHRLLDGHRAGSGGVHDALE